MTKKIGILMDKLRDSRSGEVVFVSHCLLNTNTRYLGGAFCAGPPNSFVADAMARGIGIVQMRCPEQSAWGGVLKRTIWLPFGARQSPAFGIFRLFMPVFGFYTRLRYRMIVRSIVSEIKDYIGSGFTVRAIVGVDGSPSCGVECRLSMKKSFRYYASCEFNSLNREDFNRALYSSCLEAGSGIFMQELKRQLQIRHLNVPVYAHSLLSEMNGESCDIRM